MYRIRYVEVFVTRIVWLGALKLLRSTAPISDDGTFVIKLVA